MDITPYDANPAQWAKDITKAVQGLLAASAPQAPSVSVDMTKDELKAVAEAAGIDLPAKATKEEIVSIIEGAS